jgi:hypothetical protein
MVKLMQQIASFLILAASGTSAASKNIFGSA